MRKIILASSSPRRKKLLESIGITFTVVPSNIDEKLNPRLGAAAQAKRLAFQKGSAIAEKHRGKDIVVISADTIVLCDGEQMGKPEGHDDARRMLKKLSGKKQAVVTGFTVFDCMSGRYVTKSVQTLLWTRKLSEKEIASYLKKENVFDKAGAYAIQGIGELLFERVEGDYSNVFGLPLTPLYKELKKFGVDLL